MRALIAIVGVCSALGLAACGEDSDSETAAGEEATSVASDSGGGAGTTDQGQTEDRRAEGTEQGSQGVEIAAGESQFGAVLFGGEEQAIYYFDKERSSDSECYGSCAEAWPPVLTEEDPRAGEGVESKLLGTTKRDDGSAQVTYDGHPLYYYVDDPPGQVLCHNVVEFGGTWLAVQPDGDPVA